MGWLAECAKPAAGEEDVRLGPPTEGGNAAGAIGAIGVLEGA